MNHTKKLTLGYFNGLLTQEWAERPWQGAVKAAREAGVDLISFHGGNLATQDASSQSNTIYELARGGKLDGLISWKGHFTIELNDIEAERFFKKYNIPVVTIEGTAKGIPNINYRNYEGARLLVKHLVEIHGRKKIGFMTVVEGHTGFEERFRGYQDTMKEYGLDIDPRWLGPWAPWQLEYDGVLSDSLIREWLPKAMDAGMDACIGVCDPSAVWVMNIAEELGKSVPRDLAVVGYDGFSDTRVGNPPLTTIDPDWNALGAAAVNQLIKLIREKEIPEKTVVEPRFIQAYTCGCLDPNLETAAGKGDIPKQSFRKKEKMLQTILDLPEMPSYGNDRRSISRLIDSFQKGIESSGSAEFLKILEQELRNYLNEGLDPLVWQDILSVFSEAAFDVKSIHRKKAWYLMQQARVLVSNMIQRDQGRKLHILESKTAIEQNITIDLSTTFELEGVLEILVRDLPSLEINACYIAQFEDTSPYSFPDPVSEWSRLILAFDSNGRHDLDKEGLRFKSIELLPDRFLKKSKPSNYLVHALTIGENQIGFILFETDQLIGKTCSFLSNQISSSLHGVLLIEKINNQSQFLIEGIEDLSRSIDVIVQNIEQISNSMLDQGSAVEQGSAMIEEMRGSIGRITEVTEKSSEISRKLDTTAQNTVQSVKGLIDHIYQIQSNSNNILEILNLIQSIAESIKILGFNAAVEAVHAGDKGRGFSVLAKEIRKLADESFNNIGGIETAVKSLMSRITESTDVSRQMVTDLDQITSQSRENTDLISQINVAMEEQNRGAQETLNSTLQLSEITREIKQAIQEQTDATNRFKESIDQLKRKI